MYVLRWATLDTAASDGPYLGQAISAASNKILVDVPHLLRRLRVSIDDQS